MYITGDFGSMPKDGSGDLFNQWYGGSMSMPIRAMPFKDSAEFV